MRAATLLAILLLLPPPARAQNVPEASEELERLARDGRVEQLESRLRGSSRPEDLGLLAKAYRAHAAAAKTSADRERGFEEAERRYQKWIAALPAQRGPEAARRAVEQASARIEYAGMILSQWVTADLDEFELTDGLRGDRARILRRLASARQQYEQAADLILPLRNELAAREDEFLTAGIYDTITQRWLDTQFNAGWANLFAGQVESDGARRKAALTSAERAFRRIVDEGASGAPLVQCYLALGVIYRESHAYEEAERHFSLALQAGADPVATVQIHLEQGRNHIAAGRYDAARAVLAPLAGRDVGTLSEAELGAKFYFHLARLWEANSYLVEASALRQEARKSAAEKAILTRAMRARENGLAKMGQLSRLGGAWPTIVQSYIFASLDPNADLKTLGPLELLFAAQQLSEAKRYREALERLQEAAARPALDPGLAGQILFELGVTQYRLDDLTGAASSFDRLAANYPEYEQAEQAATNAFQLWARLADRTRAPGDYERLAASLQNLLERYPRHPKRLEAQWWLPVALQAAGQYARAAEQFGNVTPESPSYEEALFRRGACLRQALEAERSQVSPDEYARRSLRLADELRRYAAAALERSAGRPAGERDAARGFGAEALVTSAEILLGPGLERFGEALETLRDFEGRYGESETLGRVLAARIRAHRGLRQFDQATALVEKYLASVPTEKAGNVLLALARGMQEEVERLESVGQAEAGQRLATDALPTFEQLEAWVRADPRRVAEVETVVAARLRMLYLAGQLDAALTLAQQLLERDPQNGNYRHTLARVLTRRLPESAPATDLAAARQAWAALLGDAALRTRAPAVYWEARYHWLSLMLREGHSAEVASAIQQERVWFPDLGGPPWNTRLDLLHRVAAERAGLPTSLPTTAP